MKTWAAIGLPVLFFLSIVVVLCVLPGAAEWPKYSSFSLIPYVLLAVTAMLGAAFSQSRIVFISLLLASLVFATDRAFAGADPARPAAVVLLSSIYAPMMFVILRYLRECNIFSSQSVPRLLMVVLSAFMVVMLPEVGFFRKGIYATELGLLEPLSAMVQVPVMGVITFVLSVPFLLTRREHENARIGQMLTLSSLYLLGALNFRSSLWHNGQNQAAFILFISGSILVLIWHILETSWREAYVDELTELPGRRSMKRHLEQLNSSFSIAVLDIDHFKRINDQYGHATGDQVLMFIATQLRNNHIGKSYRYGGEEFVLICENDSFDETLIGLEELRKSIARRKFIFRSKSRPRKKPEKPLTPRNEGGISITVSIGAARRTGRQSSPAEVFEAADKALYRAKDEGRNCLRTSR